jgi:hypothetical protein
MFGFASTLLCSWETMSATIGVSLSNGGTAGLFWNYVIVAVGLGFVYASIAELGSMWVSLQHSTSPLLTLPGSPPPEGNISGSPFLLPASTAST